MAFVLNVAISRDFGGLDFDTLIGDLPAKCVVTAYYGFMPNAETLRLECL